MSDRAAVIGFTGEHLAYRQNYMDLDPLYKDKMGDPLIRFTLDWTDHEHRVRALAVGIQAKLARALGVRFDDSRVLPSKYNVVTYQSTHIQGGAVMGTSPETSVVDTNLRHWQVRNLWVIRSVCLSAERVGKSYAHGTRSHLSRGRRSHRESRERRQDVIRQSAKRLSLGVVLALCVSAQNDAPNPYGTVEGWAKLPPGRKWGSTGAVDIDRDGKSVWVAERCGANTCLDRATGRIQNVDPILKFDEHGNLIKSFGAGHLVGPHGIYLDRDDDVWVTDYQDDGPAVPPVPNVPKPLGPPEGATRGHQVWKFSPQGKVLMTLGKPGGAAAPDYFFAPNDVIVAKDGSIFVSEGHGGGNSRILKLSKDGKLIKTWGKLGTAPGEFDMPHGLAFDSKGTLYVADRGNNRIQVFDQNGKYLSEMKQFSRPAGLFIDRLDNIYVADSDSPTSNHSHDGWRRGIRIGSLKDGRVVAYIPDRSRIRPELTRLKASRWMPKAISMAPRSETWRSSAMKRNKKRSVWNWPPLGWSCENRIQARALRFRRAGIPIPAKPKRIIPTDAGSGAADPLVTSKT